MDLDSYAAWAQQITPCETATDLAIAALSMLGDAGEVADMVKNNLRDGELDQGRLAHELGDVLFYWACLCRRAGVAPSEILKRSRESMERRRQLRGAASSPPPPTTAPSTAR
ncbi:MAG: pyrophosphatase [Alphaproteobacteria bacterium]|nr:pyrophosphatase [Alphaproteobacteria bacterium]